MASRAGRRLGVFGGTFNPPHVGHIAAAQAALDAADLDWVLFVVANDPWQKRGDPDLLPAFDRLAMTELAVVGHPAMSASRIEMDRSGPTCTVDTLEALAGPDAERYLPPVLVEGGAKAKWSLVIILGADTACRIDTWHRASELPQMAEIVVVSRPGALRPSSRLLSGARFVDMDPVAVSASELRRDLHRGIISEGALQPAVADYICKHHLWGLEPQ